MNFCTRFPNYSFTYSTYSNSNHKNNAIRGHSISLPIKFRNNPTPVLLKFLNHELRQFNPYLFTHFIQFIQILSIQIQAQNQRHLWPINHSVESRNNPTQALFKLLNNVFRQFNSYLFIHLIQFIQTQTKKTAPSVANQFSFQSNLETTQFKFHL